MTVIAYKNGILAADTLVTAGGGASTFGYTSKLTRLPGVGLLGLSGSHPGSEAMHYWFGNEVEPGFDPRKAKADFEDVYGIFISLNGEVWRYEAKLFTPCAEYKFRGYTAQGAGHLVAIGAMAAGADAVGACEIARDFETSCGGIIEHYSLAGLVEN